METEEKEIPKDLKQTLVQYRGGGYDGCWWEFNFAYFDREGRFHNVFSSGSSGCDTEEKLQKMFEDGKEYRTRVDNYYLYDLTAPEGLEEFARETNVDLVYGVSEWFKKRPEFGVHILQQCTVCEKYSDDDEFSRDGLSGDGGLAASHKENLCNGCYEENACGECGDYIWSEKWQEKIRNIIELANGDGEDFICEHCYEKNNKLKEDKFDQALRCKDIYGVLQFVGAVVGGYSASVKRAAGENRRSSELFFKCKDWTLNDELESAKLAQQDATDSDVYLACMDLRRYFRESGELIR